MFYKHCSQHCKTPPTDLYNTYSSYRWLAGVTSRWVSYIGTQEDDRLTEYSWTVNIANTDLHSQSSPHAAEEQKRKQIIQDELAFARPIDLGQFFAGCLHEYFSFKAHELYVSQTSTGHDMMYLPLEQASRHMFALLNISIYSSQSIKITGVSIHFSVPKVIKRR